MGFIQTLARVKEQLPGERQVQGGKWDENPGLPALRLVPQPLASAASPAEEHEPNHPNKQVPAGQGTHPTTSTNEQQSIGCSCRKKLGTDVRACRRGRKCPVHA